VFGFWRSCNSSSKKHVILRQQDLEFQASLGSTAIHHLRKPNQTNQTKMSVLEKTTREPF
jgi:hypothetical protein